MIADMRRGHDATPTHRRDRGHGRRGLCLHLGAGRSRLTAGRACDDKRSVVGAMTLMYRSPVVNLAGRVQTCGRHFLTP